MTLTPIQSRHGKLNPLTAEQLQDSLDHVLGLILSERRTIALPAAALARCSRQQQEWVLEWVKMLGRENVEMAYQFVIYVPQGLALMDVNGLEDWVTETLEIYENKGLSAAIIQLQAVESYANVYQRQNMSLSLSDIQGVLQIFLTGLDGRHLKLASGEVTFTDTETLFLPATLNRFVQREDNFFLYKTMATHLWAQTWFGTWRRRLSVEIARFNHREKMIRLFHTLERLRLDACIARELPGLFRDMGHLLTRLGEQRVPSGWEQMAQHLAQPHATVEESYELLEMISTWSVPPPVCYQGMLLPESVEEVMDLRRVQDKKIFQAELRQLSQSQNLATISSPSQTETHFSNESEVSSSFQNSDQNKNFLGSENSAEAESPRFAVKPHFDFKPSQGGRIPILTCDGQPVSFSERFQNVMASIVQDKGGIPENYWLAPSGGGEGVADNLAVTSHRPNEVPHSEEVFLYPEWDYRRQRYYKNWCVLREVAVPLQSEEFVTETLQRYRGLLKTLRRIFEMLRNQDQRLKRQPFGEDIDLDALVAAYAEARSGLEMSQSVFTKMHKAARHIAVLFMVDMSGSTKGWINQAERESLILLCEVLETLGDQYAIYGFSGMTRKRCEIYPIKRFDELYNTVVRQRISAISAQEYTRMGAAIRHLTQLFKTIEVNIKLLVTLSDGKPDDEGDNYRGVYGIEDTRQALLEAKREGIHPFCITIDTEANRYLPRMYGAVNYTVIDKVPQLPLKISDIYRRLTT